MNINLKHLFIVLQIITLSYVLFIEYTILDSLLSFILSTSIGILLYAIYLIVKWYKNISKKLFQEITKINEQLEESNKLQKLNNKN